MNIVAHNHKIHVLLRIVLRYYTIPLITQDKNMQTKEVTEYIHRYSFRTLVMVQVTTDAPILKSNYRIMSISTNGNRQAEKRDNAEKQISNDISQYLTATNKKVRIVRKQSLSDTNTSNNTTKKSKSVKTTQSNNLMTFNINISNIRRSTQKDIYINPGDCVPFMLIGIVIRSMLHKQKKRDVKTLHTEIQKYGNFIVTHCNQVLKTLVTSITRNFISAMLSGGGDYATINNKIMNSVFVEMNASYNESKNTMSITLDYDYAITDIVVLDEPQRGLLFSFLVWFLDIVGYSISMSLNANITDRDCNMANLQQDAMCILTEDSISIQKCIERYTQPMCSALKRYTISDVHIDIQKYYVKKNDSGRSESIDPYMSITFPFSYDTDIE